jgi:sugar phosphate isomerase/epimerase
MKLSCLPVSFFRELQEGQMTVAEWARMGARLGLDGVDLSIVMVRHRSRSGLAALRADIEAAGMGLVMLTTYPDFTHPDAAQRRRELDQAVETVQVAAALGGKYLRVTAGQAWPKTSFAEGVSWAVEGLSALQEHSRGSGVTLVYENHAKPFVWQYTDFSTTPTAFLAIAKQTEGIGLRINFDTANATAFSDDPVALLDADIGRVETVHAADTSARGELKMVLLGTGLAPFPAIFSRLKRGGFDGWICMEEGSRQGEAGVAAAAGFVRETWAKA